jgi:hypothetical protein
VTRRDPVDPSDARYVIARDKGCMAPLVDVSCGPCSGRPTIDHVKAELRMGKRAASRRDRMVAVCEGHSESGARAGRQWNTAHRSMQRDYLAMVER